MTDAELWAAWRVWMTVATVVVALAAGLLVTILATANGILREATRALRAVEEVRRNTQPIWELQSTNDIAEQILRTVESIERKGRALVQAMEAQSVERS